MRLPERGESRDEATDARAVRCAAIAGERPHAFLCQTSPQLRVHQLHESPFQL